MESQVTPEVEHTLRDFIWVMGELDRIGVSREVQAEGLALQILSHAYSARDLRLQVDGE